MAPQMLVKEATEGHTNTHKEVLITPLGSLSQTFDKTLSLKKAHTLDEKSGELKLGPSWKLPFCCCWFL